MEGSIPDKETTCVQGGKGGQCGWRVVSEGKKVEKAGCVAASPKILETGIKIMDCLSIRIFFSV